MPKPYAIVSGPIPVAPTDGLRGARGLGVIENPDDPLDADGNWTRGYTFDFGPCTAGFTTDPCSSDPKPPVEGRQSTRVIEPFLAVVGRSCSTFGWQASDFATDAARLLEAMEYGIVARELWTGAQAIASGWTNADPDVGAGNPFLAWHADPHFVDLIAANGGAPGDVLNSVEALAALEDGLAACSPSAGLIHASRRLLVSWAAHGLIVREGGRLFSITGTQIVSDRAYDGSSPTSGDPVVAGTPATVDSEWAYATGPVTVRLETSQVLTPPADDFAEAVDRVSNTISYFAERRASVSFGCCHLGVAVCPSFPCR